MCDIFIYACQDKNVHKFLLFFIITCPLAARAAFQIRILVPSTALSFFQPGVSPGRKIVCKIELRKKREGK